MVDFDGCVNVPVIFVCHLKRRVMSFLVVVLHPALVGEEISVVQQQYLPWQDIF